MKKRDIGNGKRFENSRIMTVEYSKSIDKAFRDKYGRGIPGDVFDRLKTDRGFADEFMGYINTPQKDLLSATGTDRDKLINLGLISEREIADYTKDQAKKETEEAKKQDALKVNELSDMFAGKLDDLINEISGKSSGFQASAREQRKQWLGELEGILRGEQERIFSETAPDILEQLSGRGLLNSTATGTALAKEKSRLGTITSEILKKQALSDLDEDLRLQEDTTNLLNSLRTQGLGFEQQLRTSELEQGRALSNSMLQYLRDFGTGQLERRYSLQDRQFESDLAREIARENAAATKEAGFYSVAGNVLGTLGGYGILKLSDKNAKTDMKKIGELGELGLYKFKFKKGMGDNKEHVGFMAQEVEKKAPGAVFENKGDGMKHIDMNKLNEYLDNFLSA